ncbi:anaerobic ribonucleoside-triphosphate reductase activating protein [Oscillospiraceae bacterium PP1C4]
MSAPLRISGCLSDSIVDGPGMRYVVFTQGCPHECPGCHNPQTHDFEGGYLADTDEIVHQIKSEPLLSGVTFSGGEPFCQAGALCELGERIKALGKNIVVYSGYTFEQLLKKSELDSDILRLLKLSDILIDGRFVESLRDLTLQFRGSSNQRIIMLKEALANR